MSIAEEHGRQLLTLIDKEQAELALLREQRDKKQTSDRKKGSRLIPRKKDSPAVAESEEQTDADTDKTSSGQKLGRYQSTSTVVRNNGCHTYRYQPLPKSN